MNVGELLHVLSEICRILQIEENVSISCQTLTYTGRGMVTVHFIPESQYPEDTSKVIYKPLILDEKHLKLDWSRSHEVLGL